MSEYNLPLDNPIMASLAYVACTRAKHMLYVFVQKDDPKRKVFENALSQIKCSGSIVLDGDAKSDFEFIGTVSHYSPERVGWLTVEDPAFSHGSVMFFPHDIAKAEITGLKIGQKMRFRARVEGQATIAADLSLAGAITLSESPDSALAKSVAQAAAQSADKAGERVVALVEPEKMLAGPAPRIRAQHSSKSPGVSGNVGGRGRPRKEPVIVTKKPSLSSKGPRAS